MLLQIGLLVLSLAILYGSAELVLGGAEGLGQWFGLSPLTIGLLLVGFGTSLPEFFVGHLAYWRGEPQMALGNIIGSNLANLFLIMGVAGLLAPLPLLSRAVQAQLWLHLGLSSLLAGIYFYLGLGIVGTLSLAAFFGLYLWTTFVQMKGERGDIAGQAVECTGQSLPVLVAKLGVGLVALYASGEMLVSSGKSLAALLGVPTYIVSVIFVALGTSLPELITALVATWRGKQRELITGNIIGSNIFNIAFVLGSLGPYGLAFGQGGGGYDLTWDIGILWLAALFLLLLHLGKRNFTRPAAAIFLLAYAGMVTFWSIRA